MLRETRDADVPTVVRHLYHYAGWAELMDDEMKEWKSVGVVGAIVPWNFPLMLLTWKVRSMQGTPSDRVRFSEKNGKIKHEITLHDQAFVTLSI